ncbi:MAG: hypothetical protein ACRELZ_25695 [Candidatus Rokuibacteriota bacterium]
MTKALARTWREIAIGFLEVGATAYGGPAILGIMQAEFQERRPWTSKPHFLRDRICDRPGVRAVLCAGLWGRRGPGLTIVVFRQETDT